ncbi:hypothetical protein DSM100685_2029 [Bifidobacterium avesanii]|nr:hypothetical protein DSM100685_2029 [Bifidobacterium avesanii]
MTFVTPGRFVAYTVAPAVARFADIPLADCRITP